MTKNIILKPFIALSRSIRSSFRTLGADGSCTISQSNSRPFRFRHVSRQRFRPIPVSQVEKLDSQRNPPNRCVARIQVSCTTSSASISTPPNIRRTNWNSRGVWRRYNSRNAFSSPYSWTASASSLSLTSGDRILISVLSGVRRQKGWVLSGRP